MQATVSKKRLVVYMALAGLVGGAMMSFMAPLCMIIGSYARFSLTCLTLGAVLALGVNSAVQEENNTLIEIVGGGFAAGGSVAWLLSKSGTRPFTPLEFGVIGLFGAASLAWGLGLPMKRAILVVIAATIAFPIAAKIQVAVPQFSNFLLSVLAHKFIPYLPLAAFGGVVGAVIAYTDE